MILMEFLFENPKLGLVVQTADCLPILLSDKRLVLYILVGEV